MTFTHSNPISDPDDSSVLLGSRPSRHSNILDRGEAHNGIDEATRESTHHEREDNEVTEERSRWCYHEQEEEEEELSHPEEELRCREGELQLREEELQLREEQLNYREERLHRREKEELAKQQKMLDAKVDSYCRRRSIDLEDLSAELRWWNQELTE
ncbi:MAG: hypothetical protein Q9212_000907 [Teloschistes hypoglaucus]